MRFHTATIKRVLPRSKLINVLVVVAIVAVVLALVIPPVKWASSGTIRLPVRVLVFDADSGRPVEHAHVTVFRAAPVRDSSSLELNPDRFHRDEAHQWPQDCRGETDAEGSAVIDYEFRTGANYESPKPHAHLSWAWVRIEADGFGGAVIPVRQQSELTAVLRKQAEILVPVGLLSVPKISP